MNLHKARVGGFYFCPVHACTGSPYIHASLADFNLRQTPNAVSLQIRASQQQLRRVMAANLVSGAASCRWLRPTLEAVGMFGGFTGDPA